MATNLDDSARCNLFKEIAERTWSKISRAHSYNVNVPEIGITNDILVDLLEFSSTAIQNFDVYAKPGYNETEYGSDLDIFIETNPNEYRWIALQAKVLKKYRTNSLYDSLRDGYSEANPNYQWDKLKLLEGVSGCQAFYLLYNGLEPNDPNLASVNRGLRLKGLLSKACEENYNYQQLGCSIVNVNTIEKFALRTNGQRYVNPSFEDFHPDKADPWHVLVCCYHETNGIALYDHEEIIGSNGPRKPLKSLIDFYEIEDSKKSTLSEAKEDPNNLITIAMNKSGWDPVYRLVVHRTDNTEKTAE